jgi:glycosyltransferase involved in cell wall biosynthesis
MQGATTFLVDAFIGLGSFSCLLMKPERTALVVYHVEGIKWFYQSRFSGVPRWVMPFFQATGYFIEKIQLMLLALLFRGRVVTISESTADDLVRHGFRRAQIAMMRVAISGKPLESLSASKPKEPYFTVMGINMRKGKRLDHVVKAFEKLVSQHPDARLWLAGGGGTEDDLKDYVGRSGIRNVTFWGRVTDAQRDELLQRCHVLCVPSIREGWGLVVIEANAMGTPVIAYNVPGLRDALAFDNGWLCAPTVDAMTEKLEEACQLWERQPSVYEEMRGRCLESAGQFSFEKTFADFGAALPETRRDIAM